MSDFSFTDNTFIMHQISTLNAAAFCLKAEYLWIKEINEMKDKWNKEINEKFARLCRLP